MAFTTLSSVSANEEKKCLVKSGKDRMSTYLAKYLNILCHLSLDTLPFMSTYFFGGVLRRIRGQVPEPSIYN